MSVVSGIFIIDELKGKDAHGFASIARAHNQMEEGMTVDLHLQPHLRPSRCDIQTGSKVFGLADSVTGMGVALAGIDCDVTFTDKNEYHLTKTLDVDGDIKSQSGDVVATTVSLQNHIHTVTGSFTGTVAELPATGSVTGSTDKPT